MEDTTPLGTNTAAFDVNIYKLASETSFSVDNSVYIIGSGTLNIAVDPISLDPIPI